MDPSPSNSTFNLEGTPEPANVSFRDDSIDTSRALTLEPISIEPLNSVPAMESGPSSVGDHVPSAEPVVRPNPVRAQGPVRLPARLLSPLPTQRTKVKGKGKAPMTRPTTGQLGTKSVINNRLMRGDDIKWPTLNPGETYTGTLETKSGDVSSHHYASSSGVPTPPPVPRLQVMGIRTQNGGGGKVLKIPLTAREKKAWDESTSSTPPSVGIRRHISPPPIARPAGEYEGSGETPRRAIAKLTKMVEKLSVENDKLSRRVAEAKVERDAFRRDLDTLSDGLCAKIKRAFKAAGKPHLYYCK